MRSMSFMMKVLIPRSMRVYIIITVILRRWIQTGVEKRDYVMSIRNREPQSHRDVIIITEYFKAAI